MILGFFFQEESHSVAKADLELRLSSCIRFLSAHSLIGLNNHSRMVHLFFKKCHCKITIFIFPYNSTSKFLEFLSINDVGLKELLMVSEL